MAFTAGGQTLGKMAAGIRVVPAEPGSSLDLGHAFLRELMWLVLAVPAGLGFLPVQEEDYDFVAPRSHYEKPAVAAFRALLADRETRKVLLNKGFHL